MNSLIGELLPLAAGIAISPMPIIAAILMLFSPRKSTSTGYLAGWITGVLVMFTVFIALSSVMEGNDSTGSKPLQGVIKIALGLAIIYLGYKKWNERPQEGDESELPKWMSAMDSISTVKAAGLGFALSGLNPKNLLMIASAGAIAGSYALEPGQYTVVVIVFAVVASAILLVLTVGNLLAPARFEGPLMSLRTWMSQYNSVIMAVLLLIIGIKVVGKGIGSF